MSTFPEKRQPKASAKIKDANNRSELQVKSHQHVRNAAIAEAEAAAKLKAQTSTSTAVTPGASTSTASSSFPSTTKRKQPPNEVLDSNDEADTQPKGEFLLQLQDCKFISSMFLTASSSKKTRRRVVSDDEVEIEASHPNTTTAPRRSSPPSDVDSSEVEQEAPKPTMKDRSRDIDAFFDEPAKVKDSNKPKRACKICRCAIFLVFLIYYCSIYVLDTGKKELLKR